MLTALALVAGFSAVAQAADTFMTGDVMTSISTGSYQQWRKVAGTWTLIDTLTTGGGSLTTGSAFDAAGNFYGTTFNGNNIAKFTGPGLAHTLSTFSTTDASGDVESILFDAAGNPYVGQADGTRDILKLDKVTGAIIARYDVATGPRGSDWIDLAADQKTMYYASEGRTIRRFDVSTNTQLSDFVTLGGSGNTYGFRLLSGGGMLVADAGNIKRLDATGAVVQTYDDTGFDGWFALNLDPDGTTFWSASLGSGIVHRFNIATGALVDTFNTGSTQTYGISVFGEITQSTTPVPVPGAAWMGLSLLGGLALLRSKRRKANAQL